MIKERSSVREEGSMWNMVNTALVFSGIQLYKSKVLPHKLK